MWNEFDYERESEQLRLEIRREYVNFALAVGVLAVITSVIMSALFTVSMLAGGR